MPATSAAWIALSRRNCCDPGWPEDDVALFREIFDAAVAAGWQPAEEDREPEAPEATPPAVDEPTRDESPQTPPASAPPESPAVGPYELVP